MKKRETVELLSKHNSMNGSAPHQTRTLPIANGMENNNTYNLMHQLTQESKSLWRIKNNYTTEAQSDEEKTFWKNLEHDKEKHINDLKELIKKSM